MTTANGYDRRAFLRAGVGAAAAGASAGAAATGVAGAQDGNESSGNQSGSDQSDGNQSGGNESGGDGGPGGQPGAEGSSIDGGSLLLFLVAALVAFVSPLGLAVLLFARRGGDEGDRGQGRGGGRKYGD